MQPSSVYLRPFYRVLVVKQLSWRRSFQITTGKILKNWFTCVKMKTHCYENEHEFWVVNLLITADCTCSPRMESFPDVATVAKGKGLSEGSICHFDIWLPASNLLFLFPTSSLDAFHRTTKNFSSFSFHASHSGTNAWSHNRTISFCMLTSLPLQLLSCCIFVGLLKSTDSVSQMPMLLLLFLHFQKEALLSLRHASVFFDSLQHVSIPTCDTVSQLSSQSLWEMLALEAITSLMSYYRLWPDYFLTFPRAEDCSAKLRDISINTVVIFPHSLSFTNLAGC